MADIAKLEELAKLVRYYILRMTTKAGSGHVTSALSATDIMVALFFDKLRFDLNNPDDPANDRVIFSKGHASPLLYALYAAAGVLSEKELDTYRQFQSPLEGHPTPRFKYVEVATGSLGQGLSIGLGMALAMRTGAEVGLSARDTPMVYVLLGDSEMSEGSVWEAIQLASYYKEVSPRSTSLRSSPAERGAGLKVGNLVGIIDVNRLGQSGETMLGWDVASYKKRIDAFGWQTYVVDGHDFDEIVRVFDGLPKKGDRPQMIIAKTVKGKGISFLENQEGWHGKALSEEQYQLALKELGEVDRMVRGEVTKPIARGPVSSFLPAPSVDSGQAVLRVYPERSRRAVGNPSRTATPRKLIVDYKLGEMIATRKAYGEAITKLGAIDERIVCLDAEVKNSTFAEIFKEKFPDRFLEMFIAEQNMVGVALGLSKRGKIPFVSTFAAFLTRAFDQIRMSAISHPNIKFVGSHAGVSIGEDGPSQMGLEDLTMFRAVFGSVVFCPADAVACARLVEIAAKTEGIFYIRCARPPTPVIYIEKEGEEFKIGGSKVVRATKNDQLTIVACGVAVFEAIHAAEKLAAFGVNVRVIDAYSIKPIDEVTLRKAASETKGKIITVEDHYFEGGLGDAVLNVFANDGNVKVYKLAVSKLPMSGKGEELLEYEGISADSIEAKVKEILGQPK